MRFKINPRNGVDWVDEAPEGFSGEVVTLDEVEAMERRLALVRGALRASEKFLSVLKRRGYEYPDGAPLGDAVLNHCEIALAQLDAERAQPDEVKV